MKRIIFFMTVVFATLVSCNINSKKDDVSKVKSAKAVSEKPQEEDSTWMEGKTEYSRVVYTDTTIVYLREYDSIVSGSITTHLVRGKKEHDITWSNWLIQNITDKRTGMYIRPHSDQDLQRDYIRSLYKEGDTVDVPFSYGEQTIEKDFLGSSYFPIKVFKNRFELLSIEGILKRSDNPGPSEAKEIKKWVNENSGTIRQLIQASFDERLQKINVHSPWSL